MHVPPGFSLHLSDELPCNFPFGCLQPASVVAVAGQSALAGRRERALRSQRGAATPSSAVPSPSAEEEKVLIRELQPFSHSLTCHFKQMQIKALHRVGSFPSFM